MPIDIAYIRAFLNRPGIEGPQQLRGYIPCRPRNYTGGDSLSGYAVIGASGVTIATGCDLGQTDAETLQGYGLDAGTVNQLRPYLGRRKSAALRVLSRLPLSISQDTADALDDAVHAGYLRRWVEPAYDREATTPFADLPPQAQTVVFSLCFQKGVGGTRRDCPKTWGHLTRGDWRAAADELMRGFTQYAGRRRIEGRLLLEVA